MSYVVAEVVTKYSNFVSFPVFLNGRRLNTLQVSTWPTLLVLSTSYRVEMDHSDCFSLDH